MPKLKKSVKIPKSIWVVYWLDDEGKLINNGGGTTYTDPDQIGELSDDEVVAHYHLATKGK